MAEGDAVTRNVGEAEKPRLRGGVDGQEAGAAGREQRCRCPVQSNGHRCTSLALGMLRQEGGVHFFWSSPSRAGESLDSTELVALTEVGRML
jgi:hypothetical protein